MKEYIWIYEGVYLNSSIPIKDIESILKNSPTRETGVGIFPEKWHQTDKGEIMPTCVNSSREEEEQTFPSTFSKILWYWIRQRFHKKTNLQTNIPLEHGLKTLINSLVNNILYWKLINHDEVGFISVMNFSNF